MDDCIFCKIIKGDLPSYKVYEDEFTLAFLDINPIAPGHTLIILKEHYQDLVATPAADLAQIISTVKKIAPAVVSSVGATGFNVGVNNGKVAGQLIEHVHFHLIPRKEGDGLGGWSNKPATPEELSKILTEIKQNLDV